MLMTLLGMAIVYAVGAGIVVLLGLAMQHDKNERTK
jgi:hypothetical protein